MLSTVLLECLVGHALLFQARHWLTGIIPCGQPYNGSSANVCTDMAVHMATVVGLVGAVRTGEWLFTRMYPKVNFEVEFLVAFVCTVRTCIWLLPCVCPVVCFETVLTVCRVRAVGALVRLLRGESLSLLCGLPSAKLLMVCIHFHLLRMPGLLLSIDTSASSTSQPSQALLLNHYKNNKVEERRNKICVTLKQK